MRKYRIYAGLVLGMALCLSVFCWAASHYFGQRIAYRQAEASYAVLAVYGPEHTGSAVESTADTVVAAANGTDATLEREEEIPFLNAEQNGEESGAASPVNFEALRAINPDVAAWIEIPGTNISYPIAQAADNEYYLGTTFSGGKNNSGAIFLDYASLSDLCGQHSIIYGHNMKNGSMFASLTKYKDADFFAEHPEILLYTPEGTIRLRVIAAYATRAESEMRQTEFQEDELAAYIRHALSRCAFSPELDANGIERLYTFATCSYEWDDTRTWVHAVEWFE